MFVICDENNEYHVRAGCRAFTLNEARKHWKNSKESNMLIDHGIALLKLRKGV
jgi:hypothetical protein